MANTHRNNLVNGAARKRYWAMQDELPIGAWIGQFMHWRDQPYRFGSCLRGGNMVMGHRASGEWDDCRAQDSAGRKSQRRMHKRRERQAWKNEIVKEIV